MLTILTAATIGFPTPALARQPIRTAAPPQGAPSVTLTIRHHVPGTPSTVEVRLTPPDAAGGRELFLSMTKPTRERYLKKRRVLTPGAAGVYRLEYTFPENGIWYFYLRYGPGQAGFYAFAPLAVDPRVGGEDTVTIRVRRGLSNGVPAWVQPLGYAAFGLVAALALAGVLVILNHLRRSTAVLTPPIRGCRCARDRPDQRGGTRTPDCRSTARPPEPA